MIVGRITISDRASAGIYADDSGPEIDRWVARSLPAPLTLETKVIPDERDLIAATLRTLVDDRGCRLVLTTGGTGPTPRDVTPEATRAVLDKELPGFGEVMRLRMFGRVKTSILSRATAGVRGGALIVNLPGRPRAVRECLDLLREAILDALAHLDPGQGPPGPPALT